MNELRELKEAIEFYEYMLEDYKKEVNQTNDLMYMNYLLCEIERIEDSLNALKSEYKKVQRLHNWVTH